jgi:Family of unknown function (DUF5694)
MLYKVVSLFFAIGVFSSAQAQSYQPSFRPSEMRDRSAARPNELLVLGTPHLSGLPQSFRPEMVEPLLMRLVAWRPTAIATESSSGFLCDAMRRQRERQASSVESYCYDPTLAGIAAAMDVTAANLEAERMLSSWPITPAPSQRRRLTLVFLAAGEPTSALVQWLRLSDNERRAADGLTEELVAKLEKSVTRKNEDNLIAAQLAARLGLERVWSMDDQSFVGASIDESAYGAALERAWDNPATKARASADNAMFARLGQPNGLLDVYRAYNAPSYAKYAYRSDWGAALTEASPNGYGRRYVGYWETRNLRMAANIREVLSRDPGTRMLVIVGASHKAYLEAYLHQMRDVRLVDVKAVLR